jgi:hypothetical protein
MSTVITVILTILVSLCLAYAKVTSFRPDDTTACLADSSLKCDKARSCTFQTYHPSCLAAPIPYTALDHERVSCCFKCCHFHFSQYNKLNINKTAFEDNQVYLPNYNLKSLDQNDNLLLSDSLLYQMSHSMKIDAYNSITKSPFLSYPSYKITTFKDFNSTVFDQTTKNTKRAIFVNLENRCVPREVLGAVASKVAGQGVHMISMLFSKHLPCPKAPEVVSSADTNNSSSGVEVKRRRTQNRSRRRQLRISGKNKKSKAPFADSRPGHSRPRLNTRSLNHVLSLIPYGVRSTIAAAQVKTQGVTQESHSRPRLLDCSCARLSSSGRGLVEGSKELQKLCSFGDTPAGSPASLLEGLPLDEFNYSQMVDLKNYYQSLTAVKFVLSPADGVNQSHCEWEALAFGAIPVLQSSELRKEVTRLYQDLPIHVVESFDNWDERFMNQLHGMFVANLNSKESKYSFAKLYHPYWLSLMKDHFTYGKPAQRPWRHVDILFKKTKLESCAFEHSSGKHPGGSEGERGINPYLAQLEDSNLPDRFKIMSSRPKQKSIKGPKSKSFNLFHNQRALTVWNTSLPLMAATSEQRGLSIHPRMLSTPANARGDNNSQLIELVLPRCCESGLYELEWLTQLLSVTGPGEVSVSIYYKCLECLPASLAYEWLGQRGTMFESDYNQKHNFTSGSKRITLLDDSALVAFGVDRVKQYPLFDRIHNGKEVTAYLQYILDNHHYLPKQVVFLHTSPHAHLHLPLLTKFLKYFITCDAKHIRPVDFLHLNVHYKGGPWGACCGRKGRCRESTWDYLFSDYPEMGGDYGQAATYSSAQFVVSRGAIERWPVSFWTKMMMAINGEHDLEGCPHSSDPNTPSWGGHQLTGQYERMWHIIFGQKRGQVSRRQDRSLPYMLRMDCLDDECKSGAL